jgi:hypothetical protein
MLRIGTAVELDGRDRDIGRAHPEGQEEDHVVSVAVRDLLERLPSRGETGAVDLRKERPSAALERD